MVSSYAMLLRVISLLDSGDSSLALRNDNLLFYGWGERSGDSLKNIEKRTK